MSRHASTTLTVSCRRSWSCLRRVKAKLHSSALGIGFGLAAMLLRRRLEGAQTADLLENPLRIQLVFQPLQRAIDRFTFTNNHFWHQSSLLDIEMGSQTGEPEPTRTR